MFRRPTFRPRAFFSQLGIPSARAQSRYNWKFPAEWIFVSIYYSHIYVGVHFSPVPATIMVNSSRSNDTRIIALLEQILEVIEGLTVSIQEMTSMWFINFMQIDCQLLWGDKNTFPSASSTPTSSFVPRASPPSQTPLAYSAGAMLFPSGSHAGASLSGAMQSISLQDNRRSRRYVPCSERWYCVTRGRQVGPVKGW